MIKTVEIGGKTLEMRASALIPRLYRHQFGRDLIADMNKLKSTYAKVESSEENFTALDLTIFEDVSWLMLKHAGNDVGATPDEWLDSIDGVFDIYKILPTLFELWGANMATTAIPAKK